MLIDRTPTLYSPIQAEEVAAVLTAGDEDGWTYIAQHDPKGTGYSLVAVYDEAGEFVGHF